jgi:Fe-S cluster assembly scaffold protein SufB
MIHNFGPQFHIRPKIGAIIEKNATYIENFIIIGPCSSDQAYPTVVLRGENARAVIRCIILGMGQSDIDVGSCVIFSGENTKAELISRAVVTDESKVKMRGNLKSYAPHTKGHLECRGLLLSELAKAQAYPQLRSTSPEADLTHEAAIGKIQEEELYYLMSRGLTENEATSMIARGFLDVETPGFPPILRQQINKIISMSLEKVL